MIPENAAVLCLLWVKKNNEEHRDELH